MTDPRRLVLVLAAALPLALGACDNKCPTTNPKIAQSGGTATGVPTCSGIQAGASVTVGLGVCPRCDQTFDSCTVTLPQGDNFIQLDPLVQVCTPDNSCPAPSCAPVTCTFQAPAAGTYQLLVNDPDLGPITRSFTVVESGGTAACGV